MSGVSQQTRIERGRAAGDVLRHPIMQAAADELNLRAFHLFIAADLDAADGSLLRAKAARMVHGADAFLQVLKEWVAEARALVSEADSVDAPEEQEHV